MAEGAAAFGDLAKALELAEEITGTYDRNLALRSVARLRAEAGDIADAVQAARKITQADPYVEAIDAVIEAMVQGGDGSEAKRLIDEATEAIASVTERPARINAVAAIAGWLGAVGERVKSRAILSEAIEIAHDLNDGLADSMDYIRALKAIAMAQAENDDFVASLETLNRVIVDPEMSDGFDGDNNGVPVKVGDRVGVTSDSWQARSWNFDLFEIVELHAKRGRLTEALLTASCLWNPYYRSGALAKIAREQSRRGSVQAALRTLSAARYSAERADEFDRPSALQEVAEAYLQSGQVVEALRTIERIPTAWGQAEGLVRLSVAVDKGARSVN